MRKSLDHADDLSEDIHEYGPEALVNHKIDITTTDTNVGSGAQYKLNTIFHFNSFFLIELTSGNQKSSLDTTPIGNLLA